LLKILPKIFSFDFNLLNNLKLEIDLDMNDEEENKNLLDDDSEIDSEKQSEESSYL
jgi:hypothetical protein